MTDYVEFPGPTEPFDELAAWGNCWHGRLFNDGSGAQLTTPNDVVLDGTDGIVFNYAAGCSDTHYVRNPKAPAVAPEPSADLAAAGGSWYPDAVLFSASKRYHPKQGDAVGANSWIYIDPQGMRWLMSVTFGAAQTITFGGPPYFGSATCSFSVWCDGVFGDFSGIDPPQSPRAVATFSISIEWDNAEKGHQFTTAVWNGPVEFRFDGSRAAVGGFMSYSDIGGSGTLLVQVAEITLGGIGSGTDGTGITASAAVSPYRQTLLASVYEDSRDGENYGSVNDLQDAIVYLVGWSYSKAGTLAVWERRELYHDTYSATGSIEPPTQTWDQTNTFETRQQLRASGTVRCEAWGTKTYTLQFIKDIPSGTYSQFDETTVEDGTFGAYITGGAIDHKLSNAVYALQLGTQLLPRASADAVEAGNLTYSGSGGAIAAWDPRINTIETVLGASRALAFV